MSLNWDWLKFLNPRTGRLLRESSEIFNEADHMWLMEQADIAAASHEGRLFRAFWAGDIPADTTYYFAVHGAPLVIGVARSVEVEVGELRASFLGGGSLGSIVETIPGHNLSELADDPSPIASMKRVAAYTGGTARTPSRLIKQEGTGTKVQSSAQTEIGAQVKMDPTHTGVIALTAGSAGATCNIQLYWSE